MELRETSPLLFKANVSALGLLRGQEPEGVRLASYFPLIFNCSRIVAEMAAEWCWSHLYLAQREGWVVPLL